VMRTGGPTSPDANTADNGDDDAGEYLFAPQQAETVSTPARRRRGACSAVSVLCDRFSFFCGVEWRGESRKRKCS
jgi:hypothetical protein